MNIKYYIDRTKVDITGFFVTGRPDHWADEIKLFGYPPLGEEVNSLSEVRLEGTLSLGFDVVDTDVFNAVINNIEQGSKVTSLGIYHAELEVKLNSTLFVDGLYIGDNVTMNMDSSHIDAKEISFFSVKTFKGKFLSKFPSVQFTPRYRVLFF